MLVTSQDVLDFWFLPIGVKGHNMQRPEWFRKDDAFDRQIFAQFGDAIEDALVGGLRYWDDEGTQGALARILVLDQFTRNVYRGTPKAFAGDALALEAALAIDNSGANQTLPPVQRAFSYMPFEHAENLAMQQRAVILFDKLAASTAGFDSMLDYAKRHHDVVRKFGRFPHRNEILGRQSTPDEIEFLKQPGSGF
ncbi:uncharacterized protein (DUF924 family) [Pseudoduganella flava]|uniref:DUF924 family protein n=1 Tax=Pseudoduganella flava TaxID=871742 RepID=A0A562PN98_9BURK|nr:DUF924 family protein [Pseudoduganella flava]QGZ40499.1 DUF924 family protein [Pseudoduganella flava]TWI45942.1 uncharacterized protein (DUF924 family) [Pseudoduganella flava]